MLLLNKLSSRKDVANRMTRTDCIIPIGYPAEKPVAPQRKPVAELLSYL